MNFNLLSLFTKIINEELNKGKKIDGNHIKGTNSIDPALNPHSKRSQ